jgi:hypothetical protein
MNRKFVIPVNNGEAVEIWNLLQDAGEDIQVTGQPCGATWMGLELAIVEAIHEFQTENPTDGVVYGVELSGPNDFGAVNIDHRHQLSSLQQVAGLVGVELNRHQRLVAANAIGYIPGMEAMGAQPDEIAIVRAQDRCCQGVTPDDEAQAIRDLAAAQWSMGRFGRRILLPYRTASPTAQIDRVYMLGLDKRPAEQLYTGPKWIYFGPQHQQLHALGLLSAWAGGAPESGYFGVVGPDAEGQTKILAIFNS